MYKVIKKFLIIFSTTTLLFVLVLNFNIVSANTNYYYDYDFENITEEESIFFIQNHNIEIPKKIANSSELGIIVKEIIQTSAINPNYTFIYNYNEMQTFADIIQQQVHEYTRTNNSSRSINEEEYHLLYNTVKNQMGQWVTHGGIYYSKWENYNCYSYATNRNEQPAFYSTGKQYQPGDMSGTGSFDTCNSIYELATVVKNDLEVMGYTNVVLSLTNPSSSLLSDENLICIRMGLTDYHFMKYDVSTNAWYHKPGRTAILKYNYTPNNNLIWYGEYCYTSGEQPSSTTYDSNIYFIRYNKKVNYVSSSSANASNSLTINAGKDAVYELNTSNIEYYNLSFSSNYNFILDFCNDEMETYTTFTGNNVSFARNLVTGKYYFRFNFVDSNVSGSISINISKHTNHLYSDHYEYYSTTHHYAICQCTGSILEQHFFGIKGLTSLTNENILSTFAVVLPQTCIKCGYSKL